MAQRNLFLLPGVPEEWISVGSVSFARAQPARQSEATSVKSIREPSISSPTTGQPIERVRADERKREEVARRPSGCLGSVLMGSSRRG